MQKTGDVFDPDYYLIDTKTGTVYRKEQFAEDGLLSAELVVRDRRYDKEEIIRMFNDVGFDTLSCEYVQAGKWETPLEAADIKAKELLYFGKKRAT